MKNFRFMLISLLALFVVFSAAGQAPAQKLSAEDVIARHLEAIGTAEARNNVKNQVAAGIVQFTVLREKTGGEGKIVLASENNKLLYGMTFNMPTYPAETIIYDGKKSKIAFAVNNARSQFGDYVERYREILTEGLLGGTLSTGWSLRDLASRKAKVKLDGTKKINDREAYVLEYQPRKGSDVKITIYIDAENFQHLRTEYRRVISAIMGLTPNSSSQQREERHTMIEEFSNYKKVNDVNLPHSYRVYIMTDSSRGIREHEYRAEFAEFYFNQELDPASFNTSSK
jgi:hypothetical protein